MPTVRAAALIVTAGSILILGGALAFQYIGGLAPCALCIYQRYPYVVAIVLGLAAFLMWRSPAAKWLLALAGVVLVVDAAIAGFHVGVEQKWWEGTAECGGSLGTGLSLDELKSQILAAPVVRCDEVPWSLFGISMAGYNFLLALALAATALRASFGNKGAAA